jgi:hypothetical protein
MGHREKTKNHISTLKVNDIELDDHNSKAKALFQYYCSLIGTQDSIDTSSIQWNLLFEQYHDFQSLIQLISNQELLTSINSWPSEKSPGPDGFPGEIYKLFFLILQNDLLTILNDALQPNCSIAPLNNSLIVLIPKKTRFNKANIIFSKILSNRI